MIASVQRMRDCEFLLLRSLYAVENENAKAVRKYEVKESTVRLFKRKYLEAVKARAKIGEHVDVTAIPTGRRGQKLLLGINWMRKFRNIYVLYEMREVLSVLAL